MNDEPLEGKVHKAFLVIDDNPFVFNRFELIAKKMQVKVNFAINIGAAKEKLELNKYDLIVTDLSMPDDDGEWLIRDIRKGILSGKNSQNIPIIVYSGGSLTNSARGMNLIYIQKNRADDQKLVKAIQEALGIDEGTA